MTFSEVNTIINFLDEIIEKGIPTHRKDAAGTENLSDFIVTELEIIFPERVQTPAKTLWNYRRHVEVQSGKVIPLEVVFRFGAPEGSSILRRLSRDPALVKRLGLQGDIAPGVEFEYTLIEFTTKYETTDRLLSDQEAFSISAVTGDVFSKLIIYTDLISHSMKKIFDKHKLKLWDGKFEFGLDENGDVILCDSIGPDEIRLTAAGTPLSKEMLRQAYKNSPWAEAVGKSKTLANERGSVDWKQIVTDELKLRPENLPVETVKIGLRRHTGGRLRT